jgi:hypothetical protein
LNRAGLATLLFDLLTAEEEMDRANVVDAALLTRRLTGAAPWLRGRDGARGRLLPPAQELQPLSPGGRRPGHVLVHRAPETRPSPEG